MKNNNERIIRCTLVCFLIIVFILIGLIPGWLIIPMSSKIIQNSILEYKDNEDEVIELSEWLLNDTLFSEEGTYVLYISKNPIKVDVFDWYDNKKYSIELSDSYFEYLNTEWIDENVTIEINTHSSNEEKYKSVTFKQSFYDEKAELWVYYGDKNAFPICPDDSYKNDNINKLSDRLYYSFSNIIRKQFG